MRLALAATAIMICCTGLALAQSQPPNANPSAKGRSISPETKGQKQPQGHTGPLETTGRSAPAESPQGQTPPGMHAAPDGSDKTVVTPKE